MSNLVLCESLQVLQKLAKQTTSSRMLNASNTTFDPKSCVSRQEHPSYSGMWNSKLREALRQQNSNVEMLLVLDDRPLVY